MFYSYDAAGRLVVAVSQPSPHRGCATITAELRSTSLRTETGTEDEVPVGWDPPVEGWDGDVEVADDVGCCQTARHRPFDSPVAGTGYGHFPVVTGIGPPAGGRNAV
jgi:hypothetical protein